MISFFLSSEGERASFFIDRGTVSPLFAAIRNSFSFFFLLLFYSFPIQFFIHAFLSSS